MHIKNQIKMNKNIFYNLYYLINNSIYITIYLPVINNSVEVIKKIFKFDE